MKNIKRKLILIICFVLIFTFPVVTFAHSGRTDSNGGHRDNKNKSGLGSYHYHCGGHPAHLHKDGICPYDPKDTITISNYTSTMYVGDTQSFTYNIQSVYSYVNPTISSSNSSIVSVSGTTLSAKGVGTATITVQTKTATKTFTITVKEVFAESLDISISQDKLQVGELLSINSTILPSNTTNKDITYIASDSNIATVSSKGIIKGISPGTVTVTATTSNNISKEITLEIYEVYPENVKYEETISLIVGDTYTPKITILPSNANNKNYSLTTENEQLLKVESNSIKAIKEGDTTLYIETWNGIKKEVPIHIDFIPVEDVILNDATEYIFLNIVDDDSNVSLSSELYPNNATYKDVKWTSSNEDIISIEEDKFKIHNMGIVTLTCETHDNVNKSLTLFVFDEMLFIGTCSISIIGIIYVLIRFIRKKFFNENNAN